MTRHKKPENAMVHKKGVVTDASEPAVEGLKGAAIDPRLVQIRVRPDGFYWQALDGRQEFGPFAHLELALADMEALDEDSLAPEETLREAENEIGIADWIDPETGEPAEGQSPPKLEAE